MRASGILCPISSIPSPFGIGCFSREAYEFVDFLKKAGQAYWQVLPFGPTGFGDSPYQSFSTFAGNPYFISLGRLVGRGLLTWNEVDSFEFGHDPADVDYGKLYNNRFKVLKIASLRFFASPDEDYEKFVADNAYWLDDYALYMAVKLANGGKSWTDWPEDIKKREPAAIAAAFEEHKETIDFFRFQQYMFNVQWHDLKAYANRNHVEIIGDIPFYTAFDSADTWANPEMFDFDEEMNPVTVAGCPPDAFSADGQLWGNPIYRWDYLKETDYAWWVRRIRRCFELCDVLRVDHFRAFDEYYAIPGEDKSARNGEWMPGPGIGFFNEVRKQLGDVRFIAEDLGYITESVRELLAASGFPGMKVLQFAFDSSEDSVYLPHKYDHNCVVYTGTHDNETTRSWVENANDHDRHFSRLYINSIFTSYDDYTWDFIRQAHCSVADLCIVPIGDYLVKGKEGRINHPSTTGTNWRWRIRREELTDSLAERIYGLTKMYGRLPAGELADIKLANQAAAAIQSLAWVNEQDPDAVKAAMEKLKKAGIKAERRYGRVYAELGADKAGNTPELDRVQKQLRKLHVDNAEVRAAQQ